MSTTQNRTPLCVLPPSRPNHLLSTSLTCSRPDAWTNRCSLRACSVRGLADSNCCRFYKERRRTSRYLGLRRKGERVAARVLAVAQFLSYQATCKHVFLSEHTKIGTSHAHGPLARIRVVSFTLELRTKRNSRLLSYSKLTDAEPTHQLARLYNPLKSY